MRPITSCHCQPRLSARQTGRRGTTNQKSKTPINPHLQNKTLSDPHDAVLTLQGVGWLKRKAINLATVTLTIKQYNSAEGVNHIDIDSVATGGIKGTSEERILDWTARSHEDHVFGSLSGKSRWISTSGPEWAEVDSFLKEGWLQGVEETKGPNGEANIQNHVVNQANGWEATQVWGFAEVNGTRYHARRVIVRKLDGSEELKIRLIYDWTA